MNSEEKLKQVIDILARVADDSSIPRNIRRAAAESKNLLFKKGEDPVVMAASARMLLEDISNDPNMPVHARTQIWNALSVLETIQ